MTGFAKALKRAAVGGVAAIALLGAGTAAQAQNWEGNHQVRGGFFLQSGRMGYDISSAGTAEALDHNSFAIGATGGLEWIRAGRFTFGAELDISASTGDAATTLFTPGLKLGSQFFASLRGRAGFYLQPNFVLYGTAGWGALGTEVDQSPLGKVANTNTGAVYGGGLEYHRGGTILFAEYLHGNFGHRTATIGATAFRYDADMSAFRLGVKFKLGHDWRDEVRGHDRGHEPLK